MTKVVFFVKVLNCWTYLDGVNDWKVEKGDSCDPLGPGHASVLRVRQVGTIMYF